MTNGVPAFLRRRAWWLLPLLIWAATVTLSLRAHLDDQEKQNLAIAAEGIRNIFHMVVLTRAWNANHGGVYVPITDKVQPNPHLVHPHRDLTTTDGIRLTMVNPAYMTRQMSELAFVQGEVAFHITSLKPIRPENKADEWERAALESFEKGAKERIELLDQGHGRLLRYMAPLLVTRPCLACHAKQGYRVGDVRGGISVSLPYTPFAATERPGVHQEILAHATVFLLVAALGWLLLELLRHRWIDLAYHIDALDSARSELEASNQALVAARDEAEAASRAKSAFLTTMSHEIRTPLNAILGTTALLRTSNPPPDQQDKLEALHRSGQGLLSLVNDVLDFSRMEANRVVVSEHPFEPHRLLKRVAAQFRPRVEAKGLRLDIRRVDDERLWVLGDEDHLRRILANLIDNALKFTDQGGIEVWLETEAREQHRVRLRFGIRDSGIGMNADTLTKLFQPFMTADASTTRRHGGIGLDLAICKRLADAMGGQLEATSTLGVGSLFTLTLELAATDAGTNASNGGAAEIGRLVALLQQDNITAADLYAELAPALAKLMGDQFAELETHMAGFEYAQAAAQLKSWQDQAD